MSGTTTTVIVSAVVTVYGTYLAYVVYKLRQRDPQPDPGEQRDVS